MGIKINEIMGFATRASSGDYDRYHEPYSWPYDDIAPPPEYNLESYSPGHSNTIEIESRVIVQITRW